MRMGMGTGNDSILVSAYWKTHTIASQTMWTIPVVVLYHFIHSGDADGESLWIKKGNKSQTTGEREEKKNNFWGWTNIVNE